MEAEKVILKNTLLRYNNPITVSKRLEESEAPIVSQENDLVSGKSMIDLSLKINKAQSIEDVLNCIFPPKEWEENSKRWMQTVSSEPGTSKNVRELWEELDAALSQEGARETGICPKRRELFDQCFDELLRQEAINCCERGLLLKLIRDNLRMEMNTLESLYESSIAFGLRKTLLLEEEKNYTRECIVTEKEKEAALQQEINELNMKITLIESNASEEREIAAEENRRQVDKLREEMTELKKTLEKVIYPKK